MIFPEKYALTIRTIFLCKMCKHKPPNDFSGSGLALYACTLYSIHPYGNDLVYLRKGCIYAYSHLYPLDKPTCFYKVTGHYHEIFQIKTKVESDDGSPAPRSFFAWLADNQDASNDEIAEVFFCISLYW